MNSLAFIVAKHKKSLSKNTNKGLKVIKMHKLNENILNFSYSCIAM